jgi:predicted TIM-barrel fold metal-dependent hydrolase
MRLQLPARAQAIVLALLLTGQTSQAQQREPLIDVHVHLQIGGPNRDFVGGVQSALATMDRLGIARSLLMPPPIADGRQRNNHDIEDLAFARRDHPKRFALLGGSSLNLMLHHTPAEQVDEAVRQKFRARAMEIVRMGAVGFGEIAALHVSIPAMGPQHAYEMVPPDHPLLLLLADISAETGLPVDLHLDLVPEDMPLPQPLRANTLNPDTLQANLDGFKRLLAHNPKARIVWSHVGFEPLMSRPPARVRALLEAFPNLFMSFRLNRGAPHPAAALDQADRFKPQWLALVEAFPERFMLGSDAFYERQGVARGSSEQGVENLRRLVESLAEPARSLVARGNAVRLYKLEPLSN